MSTESNGVRKILLKDDGQFPNNPNRPLLIYPSAVVLSAEDPAESLETLFREHGWRGLWRDGIYRFHHYHSNTHEVLGVFRGTARVQFGGPDGVEVDLKPGDVAVLPAGTAHRNLESSHDFGVIGGYPAGAAHDMYYGRQGERSQAIENIKRVADPETDPVFGHSGGLCDHWAV